MTHLQEQLEALRETLSDMAAMVKTQLKKSVCALMDRNEDLANEVVYNERRVNALELTIDKDCENIFTLLTPVAHDMRFVFATLKINSDLERIGDYAEGIAKLVLMGKLEFDKKLVEDIRLNEMYEIADGMLEDVITDYSHDGSRLARTVFSRDLILNDINHAASKVVINYCRANIDNMEQAIYLLSIVRKMERVGDHLTNIAEEVIFYKEAKVLRHGDKGGERR